MFQYSLADDERYGLQEKGFLFRLAFFVCRTHVQRRKRIVSFERYSLEGSVTWQNKEVLRRVTVSDKEHEFAKSMNRESGFLKEIVEKNITQKLIPKGMSWFGCMGGISLVAFLIQTITGVFLMFYFVPSTKEAVASIQQITHHVPFGWFMQHIHAVGPNIMIGVVVGHMARIFYKGIYRHPRELHWVSGSCLFILTLLMYYTGNLLSVDNMNEPVAIRLSYLYVVHVAVIPGIMVSFMGMHFFMIRKTGICEPL